MKKWKALGGQSPLRTLRASDYMDDEGMLQSKDYKTKVRPGKHVSKSNIHLSQLRATLTYFISLIAIHIIYGRWR